MKVRNIVNKLKVFVKRNGSTITSSISILIGIFALGISILTYNNANTQFEKNSNASDSLFNVQLRNERQLNDSLIKQIQTLQRITNNQLRINDEQLRISTKSYKEQLNSGKSKITIKSNKYKKAVGASNDSPIYFIETKIENTGLRPAYKVNARGFIVFKDLSYVIKNIDKDEGILDSSKERVINYYPNLKPENEKDFFYCFEISYYDGILNETYKQSYYYHYHLRNKEIRFYNCTPVEKQKVKTRINKLLNDLNIDSLLI